MTSTTKFEDLPLAKNQWPLRFDRHSFDACCFNTQRCSILYDRHQFGDVEYEYDGTLIEKSSGPPYAPNWKDDWSGTYLAEKTFPSPVEIRWRALDGSKHEADVDLDAIFKDRLVLHHVAREDIPENWAARPLSANILVEVNDRVINVYMKVLIATKHEQIPGKPHSRGRRDVILAWSHTY